MNGIINGKDVVDGTISEVKLTTEVKTKLLQHAKITDQDLSADGATGELNLDG